MGDRPLLAVHVRFIEERVSIHGMRGCQYRYDESYQIGLETHGAQKVLTHVLPGKSVPNPDGC